MRLGFCPGCRRRRATVGVGDKPPKWVLIRTHHEVADGNLLTLQERSRCPGSRTPVLLEDTVTLTD